MWSIPCWESLSTIWPQRCYSKWDTDDQSLTIKGCQPCFLGGVRLCSGSRLVGTGSSVSLMIRQLYSEILWLYDDFLCLFIANEANYLPIAVGLNPDFVALPSPCWRWTTTVAVVSPRWSWGLFLGFTNRFTNNLPFIDVYWRWSTIGYTKMKLHCHDKHVGMSSNKGTNIGHYT